MSERKSGRRGAARWIGVVATAGVAIGLLATVPAVAEAAAPSAGTTACPWMDTTKTPAQRAQLLLDASTLDQKLRWLDEQAANSPKQTSFTSFATHITVTYPVQVACTPTVVYTDGPDYVRGSTGVTVFPAQIALGASFDTALSYDKGKAQADEAFRSGKNVILGPGISSSRTPLAGRTPEYLGEDSLLSGLMAAAGVDGIQKGNPDEPVMSVLKHYVGNEQELDRQTSSDNVDGRTLREVYNLPFEITVKNSSPGGVMCSYNQINGVYACESPVLKNLLKGEDGFDGYVTSDFFAIKSTSPSLNGGLDQELNAPIYFTPDLIHKAIDAGQITASQIDEAAFRVVKSYIQAGLFDHPLPATPSTSSSNAANKAVAEQIAEKGSVLLKNDGGILPLTGSSDSVAVIGPTASNTPTNGVSAATVCNEHGTFGGGNACPNPVAPLDAITARAAKAGATVTFDNGADVNAAAAAAASAKVAIVFGYAMQGEGADRTTLALDNNGDALISAVAAANPNTIVVLETGSATTMPWLGQVKGVIEAWYPGDQQGTALARLLYGDANFTGRLPMTFPRSLADTPTAGSPAQYPGLVNGSTTRPAGSTAIRQVDYTEGLAVGYKWYQSKGIAPLFPFGYGLSYTTFSYSGLQVSPPANGKPDGKVKVTFTVKNTGSAAGEATPQVYLTLPGSTGEPGSRLVSFSKVSLTPGESRKVNVLIDPKSSALPLSYWNTTTHAWAIAPGAYQVDVATDAATPGLTGSFSVAP